MSFWTKILSDIDSLFGNRGSKFVFNKLIKEYGKMLTLSIDPKEKKITATVLLKGEFSPVSFNIKNYEIIDSTHIGGKEVAQFVINEASCDREWMNTALNRFIVGKAFNVPTEAITLLNEFLG